MRKHPFLEDVRYDKALKIGNDFVHNYRELANIIKFISASEFKKHVNHNVLVWLEDNYGDVELINKLKHVKSRKTYQQIIQRRIEELSRTSLPIISNGQLAIFAGILILLTLLGYVYVNAQLKENSYKDNINFLQESISKMQNQLKSLEQDNQRLSTNKSIIQNLTLENEILIKKKTLLENTIEEYKKSINQKQQILGPIVRVNESELSVYGNKVTVNVSSAHIARIADTGSMLPTLVGGAHTIEMIPESLDSLRAGDIISFKSVDGLILHRIKIVGMDELGWYAITKGDNNLNADPNKVRFSDIKGIVVGVIY